MKRFKRLILVVLAVAALSLLAIPAVGVSATKPAEVIGTHTPAGPPVNLVPPKIVGMNTILVQSRVSDWVGDIVGTRSFEIRIVIHPNGKVTAQSSGVFVGSILIDGVWYTGSADMDGSMLGRGGDIGYTATVRIQGHKGTGLEGVHGVLDCWGIPGTPGNYSGRVH